MAPNSVASRSHDIHQREASAGVESRISQSAAATSEGAPAPQKRAYKACESCRKNKAKCVMSSQGEECVKCRREGRECVFPLHRSSKRRRLSSVGEVAGVGDRESPRSQYTTLLQPDNGTTHAADPGLSHQTTNINQNNSSQHPLAGTSRSQVEDRTSLGNDSSFTGDLGAEVVQTVVTSSRDAIGLLFKAAARDSADGQDADDDEEGVVGDESRGPGGILSPYATPDQNSSRSRSIPSELLALWNKHRFVRQGWFTAYEAIAYVQFFFNVLSPLSPVAQSLHGYSQDHQKFVYEEPLLCCTVLSIAARHLSLPGPDGAVHSMFIHGRLWKHVEHLVQRITFGMEKYSSAKSRTLGSIQALLLMIEWHPRSLHFPPDNDGWDASLAPSMDDVYEPRTRKADAANRWRDDVFEPAKRSDRMSWTLVGLAVTLAHELGVFDRGGDEDESHEAGPMRGTRLQIKRLLYLFTSQLSLRLGCTNIFPQSDSFSASETPGATIEQSERVQHDREIILSKWIGITKLLTMATHMFFPNKAATKHLITSYRYLDLLGHFKPLLAKWWKEFEEMQCPTTAEPTRQLLLVEYYYVDVFVNSVALQALVVRLNETTRSNAWLHREFLRQQDGQDLHFINNVRESSQKILAIARKLSDEGHLQYCPVRLFLRVVAASIFLLKAISLGAREADANQSLHQLDRCIEALIVNRSHDVHLSARYADLLARYVSIFRRNLKNGRRNQASGADSNCTGERYKASSSSGDVRAEQRRVNAPAPEGDHVSGTDRHEAAFSATSPRPTDFDPIGMSGEADMSDWLAQPFDPQVAPFGIETDPTASGFTMESLDFLWSM